MPDYKHTRTHARIDNARARAYRTLDKEATAWHYTGTGNYEYFLETIINSICQEIFDYERLLGN